MYLNSTSMHFLLSAASSEPLLSLTCAFTGLLAYIIA
jgi:hypothetical protein